MFVPTIRIGLHAANKNIVLDLLGARTLANKLKWILQDIDRKDRLEPTRDWNCFDAIRENGKDGSVQIEDYDYAALSEELSKMTLEEREADAAKDTGLVKKQMHIQQLLG